MRKIKSAVDYTATYTVSWKKKILLIFLLILTTLIGTYCVRNKLTYIEHTMMPEGNETTVSLKSDGGHCTQTIEMPYDILYGISVKTNQSNLSGQLQVYDINTGKILCETTKSNLAETEAYHLFSFGNIRLQKGKQYGMRLELNNIDENETKVFFMPSGSGATGEFFVDETPVSGSLCINIYGGDCSFWWIGLVLFCGSIGGLILIRLFLIRKPLKRALLDDLLLQAMILTLFLILLQYPFSQLSQFLFLDEVDNIRGGMVIAKGGVLYRDYITQHTPVVYYLCALFAKVGACSVAQFRICYYVMEAAFWGGLYYRHAEVFGSKKMLVLPIAKMTILSQVYFRHGYSILSDGLQGLCMIALLLEFLRYQSDRELTWGRCWIVSLSVLGSIGAAFVSVYAIFWVIIFFCVMEIVGWIRNKKEFCFRAIFLRYYKLLLTILIPVGIVILYFSLNHALAEAYSQAYLFNRVIYPKYYNQEYNSSIFMPFLFAIKEFILFFADGFRNICSLNISIQMLLQLLLMVVMIGCLLLQFIKKRKIFAILGLLTFLCSATRGYEFHALPAWYIAILIIIFSWDLWIQLIPKMRLLISALIIMLILGTYLISIRKIIITKQALVSDMEIQVVGLADDDKEIFGDMYIIESVYLLHKEIYPVNRLYYFLPWYMEQYENELISDLKASEAEIVVYDEDLSVWGYQNYAEDFTHYLEENYTKYDNSNIWIKDNEK